MKTATLGLLICPVCHEPLEYKGKELGHRLVRGVLRCLNNHLYQVKGEIPLLKHPKLSRGEFTWKVKFPNLQRYEEIQRQYWSYLSEGQRRADEKLMNQLAKTASKENLVLDIASGMGRLLLALSPLMGDESDLLGTDVDETPLRGAKLKLKEQNSYDKVSLCVMDGKHLAVKKQRLPCATSYFGLDNIPDTAEALQELTRVLIPKGRLVMATLWLEENSKSLSLAEKHGYATIATRNRLFKTFETTGFKLDSVQIYYSGNWPYNPMDRIPMEGDWFAHALVLAHRA